MRISLVRAARAAVATVAAAALVLLSVPFAANAAAGDSIINVKVGGARVAPGGVTDVSGLQGVLLQLYTDGNDREGDPVAGAAGQCTTDVNGLCSFTIPQTQNGGTNHDARFWVKEVSASNGNNAVLNLTTGSTSGFDSTPYVWRTPELSSDTVNLPAQADMPDNYNPPGQGGDIPKSRWATTGIFPASLKNPRYVAVCNVPPRIGILFDLSTSMEGDGITGARTAGKAMVDALVGSGALLGLYNFGTNAPKSGESNYAPIAVTAGNAATFKSQIDGYDAGGTNYTNWDRGLWQLRDENLDIVIVLTDGNPTVYGDPATPGSGNTYFNHTEQAIFSANTLKSVNGGTQILTFGVGDGVSGTPDNLAAVSGPIKWAAGIGITAADYAQTDDWDLVKTQLAEAAKALTCQAPIKVIKQEHLLNGTVQPGPNWDFTATRPAGNPGTISAPTPANGKTAAGTGEISWNVAFNAAGQSTPVTIAETLKSGWAVESVTCTNNGSPVSVSQAASFTLPTVGIGSNIVCTVVNQQLQALLKVDKTWVINGTTYADGSQLPSSVQAQLKLSNVDQAWGTQKSYTIGTNVTITEVLKAGFPSQYCTLDSATLNGPGVTDKNILPGQSQATGNLQAGLTVYTIKNVVTCKSELTLVKSVQNTHGGNAMPNNWDLNFNGPSIGSVKSGVKSTVTPGIYTITESNGPAGYDQTNLVCDVPLTGNQITVPLATSVTCTFTNADKAATLTLNKVVVGAPGVLPSKWTLTAKNGSNIAVLTGNGTATGPVNANTQFTLSETAIAPINQNDFTASAWVCQTGTQTPVTLSGGILPGLAPGSNTVCVITNTAKTADPTITKTATSFVPNANGTWSVTYDVVVTNTSKFTPITYNLSDAFAFGDGIALVGPATATGPSGPIAGWTGMGSNTLASGVALAAQGVHTYTITATVSLEDGIDHADLVCPGPTGNGGTMNRATLTVGDHTYSAQACKSPVIPEFDKVADPNTPAVANPDGTWTLTYKLTVKNPSATQGVIYDLSDTPDFPSGVVIVSTTANGTPFSGTIVTGKALAANTTDTYTVVAIVKIPSSVPPAELLCTQGNGFINNAVATSSGQTLDDSACISVTPPTITHEKTVTSVAQNVQGTWDVEYKVVVTNASAAAGYYDLTDDLQITVPGVLSIVGTPTASGPGGPIPTWNGDTDKVLADEALIAANSSADYVIKVTVAVAPGELGNEAARCVLDGGTNGFLNDATLTVGGNPVTDSACASPAGPEVEKEFTGAVPTGPGTWNVSYTITVTNTEPNGHDSYYTLDDTLGFSPDVTPGEPTVTETTGGASTPVDWNGGNFVPDPKLIAGGATHTYVIVVPASVPAGSEDLECGAEPTPGHGFYNGIELTSGGQTYDAWDCGDVTESVVPTISKSLVSGYPQQRADGKWVIRYDVTVSSTEALAAEYSLSDSIEDFGAGILIDSAGIIASPVPTNPDWDGMAPNTGVVTDVTLPAGTIPNPSTHVYRFEVVATVPIGAYEDEDQLCETGQPNADPGGFLNTAILSSGDVERRAQACGEPAQPTFEKTLDPNAPLALVNGKWVVGYLLKVTNASALQLSYDLSDTLGFPAGVTISDQAVSSTDVTVNPLWTGIGGPGSVVVTGQLIPANTTHTFKVTANATITSEFDLDDAECGDPEESGQGLFNGAVMTSGGIPVEGEACDDLPVAELTLVKKVDNDAFDNLDLDGHTLAKDTDWTLTAAGPNGTNLSGVTGSDEVTTVLVPAGEYAFSEQPIADPSSDLMDYYEASDWDCLPADAQTLNLEVGDKVTCTIENTGLPVDLKIVKSDDGVVIDQGEAFSYTFTVENNGSIAAQDVVITDVIPATLQVDVANILKPAGWEVHLTGQDGNGFGGTLTFEKISEFAAGGSAQFTIPVQSADDLPREGDDPTGRILDIVNLAKIGSSGVDEDPSDNESEETTPVKSLAIEIVGTCTLNAPYATWSITPFNTDPADTVAIIWWTQAAYDARNPDIPVSDVAGILADGALQVDVLPAPPGGWSGGDEQTGTQLWAGASVDPVTHKGNGWPGYVLVNGVWKLDPTNKFYPIRNGAVVEVRMNPSTGATVGYPPASINCSAFPPFEFPTLALTGAAGVATWIVASGLFLLFGVFFVAAARRKAGRHGV